MPAKATSGYSNSAKEHTIAERKPLMEELVPVLAVELLLNLILAVELLLTWDMPRLLQVVDIVDITL